MQNGTYERSMLQRHVELRLSLRLDVTSTASVKDSMLQGRAPLQHHWTESINKNDGLTLLRNTGGRALPRLLST